MGAIDLDPASHEEANRTVQARHFYTEELDGLSRRWFGRVFLNPPGGLVNEFWSRLVEDVFRGAVEQCVWIGYSLEQLQTLQSHGHIKTPLDFAMCIPSKRIAFVENEAKRAARIEKLRASGKNPNAKSQPSHGNYVTYIGLYPERFASSFRSFGRVVTR